MATMTLLYADSEVAAALDASTTVDAMRAALVAAYEGRLVAPPRAAAPLGGGRLMFTAGHLVDEWYGFRSYDTFGHPEGEQLVVLHDAHTGAVRAVAVGEELGSRRTGGLGGVAVDALARPDAATVGVIGSGRQAWTQVWATAAVRPLREVVVHSRSAARRTPSPPGSAPNWACRPARSPTLARRCVGATLWCSPPRA